MTKAVTDVELQKVYSLFFQEGEVVEIRALGLRGKNPAWDGFAGGKAGIVSGYFNDPEKFAAAAYALEKAKARGIYFTANPCKPALLSRAANRLICPHEENTTPDMYMACLRWFLIDLDAKMEDGTKRPKGVSATDEELKVCQAATETIAKYLEEEQGFARGLRAFSGNGYHLMYRLPDLPNNDEHKAMVRDALAALDAKFPDTVDLAVFNPGRIWKFYGTTGRKGDSTPERPHRRSYIYTGQPENLAGLPITELETFKKFAALAPAATSASSSSAGVYSSTPALPPSPGAVRMKPGELGPIDMEKYLMNFGITFSAKEKSDKTHGPAMLYVLDTCLFNPDHGKGEAAIVVPQHGAIKYQCFHDSCKGKTWKDARRIISGDRNLAEFCTGFDPNWKPKTSATAGIIDLLNTNNYPDLLKSLATENIYIPPPEQISEKEFFEVRNQRPVFVARKMVNYLIAYLSPIVCTDAFFWRYDKGLWKAFPKNKISKYIALALKSKASAGYLDNALKIFSSIINREEEEWPKHPEYINVLNGVLDVNTMNLMPHSPDFGCRTQLPVNYNPDAFSQRWCDFLNDIFPDDKNYEKRGVLMQYFGYCLLRDCRYQMALFAFGTGSNGKSTVIDVLTAMIGEENTCSLTLSDIAKQFRPQLLQEKLVNMASETDLRNPLATEVLKQCISGDMITVERKHGPPYQFRPYAKFIVSMNDAPTIPDRSYGFSRRIAVLGFKRRFLPAEIITNMSGLLIEEIDGVFNWAVDGLRILLRNNGFKLGETVEQETAEMMETLNPILIFTNEMAWVKPDKIGSSTTDVWDCYRFWCREGKNRPLGRNRFLSQILQTYPETKKKQVEDENESRTMRFIGYGLTDRAMAFTEEARKTFNKYSNFNNLD